VILLLDLATTGTNPEKDLVLEVAWILTRSPGFPILEADSVVVGWGQEDLAVRKPPAFHGRLLQESAESEAVSIKRAQAHLLALPKFDVIANRRLDFDLDFLRQDFPEFAKGLRYVSRLDVKALGEVFGPLVGEFPAPDRTHRAPDEVLWAYEEMVHYADVVEAAFGQQGEQER
jgi:oligoribonuclease (3'-5' exoribonuclease)